MWPPFKQVAVPNADLLHRMLYKGSSVHSGFPFFFEIFKTTDMNNIIHHIHYNDKYKGKMLDCIWEVKLPFRLVKGDNIHCELFDKGKLENGKTTPALWDKLCAEEEFFDVLSMWIDHNGIINVIIGKELNLD